MGIEEDLAASAARAQALKVQLAQEVSSTFSAEAKALGAKLVAIVEEYGPTIALEALRIALGAAGVPAPLLSLLDKIGV